MRGVPEEQAAVAGDRGALGARLALEPDGVVDLISHHIIV